ncbi:MAG: malate synthase G, partial [Woeseiaceae bacterium]|nr:malate synthase G [Woeseiaceae bacterium]
MSETRRTIGGLNVDNVLHDFVERELLPLLDIEAAAFWSGLESIIDELTPINRELLLTRDILQQKIDDWHESHPDSGFDHDEYVDFLRGIGYLVPAGEPFSITTTNVDPEIADIAGPQLVVPVSNARFAINATNARWGSLYDALYGTDVIDEADGRDRSTAYNPVRGEAVIAYARAFLDRTIPLASGSHADVGCYGIDDDGAFTPALRDPDQFAGHREDGERQSYLFVNHGLHIELCIDAGHPIGKTDKAHVSDVVLESAVTTIQDCEDSVAAVDAEDKASVYRNWLGLMRGDLTATFDKGGKPMTRELAADRSY